MTRLALLLATLAIGCETFAPTPDDALGPSKPVYTELLEQKRGELRLEQNGRWIFASADGSKLPTHPVGTVFAYADIDSKAHHFFGLVSAHSWGLELQRLDTNPIITQVTGDLIPLKEINRQVLSRWEICADIECLENSADGVYWHIYPADGLLLTRNGNDATLPFVRDALFHESSLGDQWFGEKPANFLAVPGDIGPSPAKPILAGRGCDADIARNAALPSHPLDVEEETAKLGADVLVDCGDEIRFVTPTLFRATTPGSVSAGISLAPLVGVKPRKTKSQDALSAAGYAANGEFVVADFFLERFARARGDSELELMLVLSELGNAANRPESALRHAFAATLKNWNRATNTHYILVKSGALDLIGAPKDAAKMRTDLISFIEAEQDDELYDFLHFFKFRKVVRANVKPGIVSKKDQGKWRTAYAIEKLRQIPEAQVPTADYPTLIALAQRNPQPYKKTNGYGLGEDRDVVAAAKRNRTLLTAVPIETWKLWTQGKFQNMVLSSHLLDLEARDDALRIVENAALQIGCDFKRDGAIRHAEIRQQEEAEYVSWLVGTLLPARCKGELRDLAAATEDADRLNGVVAIGVHDLIQQPDIAFDDAKFWADTASRVQSPSCKTIGTAVALKYLESAQFEEADKVIKGVLQCAPDSDVQAVAAYTNFEVTQSLSADYDLKIRERVANALQITPDSSCVGAALPQFDRKRVIPTDVLQLAEKITAAPVTSDMFRILFASDALTEANASIAEIGAALKEGNYDRANVLLTQAHEAFTRLQNVPGLRRTDLLRRTILADESSFRSVAKSFKRGKTPSGSSAVALWLVGLSPEPTPSVLSSDAEFCRPLTLEERNLDPQSLIPVGR